MTLCCGAVMGPLGDPCASSSSWVRGEQGQVVLQTVQDLPPGIPSSDSFKVLRWVCYENGSREMREMSVVTAAGSGQPETRATRILVAI